jgi:hypothetical protein
MSCISEKTRSIVLSSYLYIQPFSLFSVHVPCSPCPWRPQRICGRFYDISLETQVTLVNMGGLQEENKRRLQNFAELVTASIISVEGIRRHTSSLGSILKRSVPISHKCIDQIGSLAMSDLAETVCSIYIKPEQALRTYHVKSH